MVEKIGVIEGEEKSASGLEKLVEDLLGSGVQEGDYDIPCAIDGPSSLTQAHLANLLGQPKTRLLRESAVLDAADELVGVLSDIGVCGPVELAATPVCKQLRDVARQR